ncbi:hypothetical protein [Proteiniphilum sp. UBA5384]|uniref:hypothetical protein n=1 Tax=Proteiniphilum sp. UBA5384 TaxID=1947279 RepID=UPI0025EE2574|nr:hypothetical protein [Proteiniphilum sp. UBA5384]
MKEYEKLQVNKLINKIRNIMKIIGIKKKRLIMMTILISGFSFMLQAQESSWEKQRAQYLKKQLELTEEQADQIYEALTIGAQERQDIKENTTGNALKKTLWQVDKKQNDRISSILTPSQNKKLKELREQEKMGIQKTVQQMNVPTNPLSNQWAKQRSQYLKKELGLTDEQTDRVYEELATATEREKSIKEKTTGDVQKNALWNNEKERNNRLSEILTPQQAKNLEELRRKGK